MGRKLKLKQDRIRFSKISKLCKGKILHLGSSDLKEDYNLHRFLKKRHKDVYSVGLTKCDFIQNLNLDKWTIPGTYDTVLGAEVIEHIENPSSFLRNCAKYTKSGGRIIIATPNASSVIYIKNPKWCVNYDREYKEDNSHIHAFTTGMLQYLIERVGVKNVRYEYLNGYLRNPFGYFIGSLIPRLRGDILIWGEKI